MKKLLLWTEQMRDKCIIQTPSNIDPITKRKRDEQTSIVTSCVYDSIYRSKNLSAFIPISNAKLIKKYPMVFTPSNRLKFDRGLEFMPFSIEYGDKYRGATTFTLTNSTLADANYYNNIGEYETVMRNKQGKQFRLIDLYETRKLIQPSIKSRHNPNMYRRLEKYQIPCKICLNSLYDYMLEQYYKAFTLKNDKVYAKVCQTELSLYHMLSVGSMSNMVVEYYPTYKVSKIGGRLFERRGAQRLPNDAKQSIMANDYDIKRCNKTALEILLHKHRLLPNKIMQSIVESFDSYSSMFGMYKQKQILMTLIYREWSYPIKNKMGIPLYIRKRDVHKYRKRILAHLIFGMEVYALIKAITRKGISFMSLEHDGFRSDKELNDFRQDGFLFRCKSNTTVER